METSEPPLYFGEWLRARRIALDLTQAELAARAGCSVAGLRKIETGERRPSKELAELLALALEIDSDLRTTFIRAARGELNLERLGAPMRGRPTGPSPAPVIALPIAPTPFIGRRDELGTLIDLLSDPTCRLLTLIGPGGIGKTRLAVEVAAQEVGRYADGVCFVSLAMVSSAAFLAPAIADALGYSFQGQVETGEQLLNHLRSLQLLMVLDNMEHLLDGAEYIVEIITRCPRVKLVVTSRERLNLPGEWVYEIAGLPVPKEGEPASTAIHSAITLFLQSARRARANFEPTEDDLHCIARICRTLEGVPLGIELAAAWVFALAICEIADRIDNNLDFLETTMRGVPERQRSLRAAFEHSWNLLAAEDRRLLSRLAVFQGGFEPRAAEQVAGASPAALLALASKSLLRRRGADRFDLHEVVRQYALAQLMTGPDYQATMDAYSDYYLAFLAAHERDLKGPAQAEALRRLIRDISNIRSAWAWATEHRRLKVIGRALRSYGHMCEVGGRLREGIDELELIVRALEGSDKSPEEQAILSQAFAQQGLLRFRLGEFERAMRLFANGLALARALGDSRLIVQPLIMGGIISHLLGDYDRALEAMREGTRHARMVGDDWFTIYAPFNIGYIAGLIGDYERGYELMRHSLAAWRVKSDPRSVALGLNYLSPTLIALNRYEEARTNLAESIALCAEIDDRWGLGTAYRQLGTVALAQGRLDEARTLLNRSLEMFDGYIIGYSVIQSLISLGDCARVGGEKEEAEQFYRKALQQAVPAHIGPLAYEALAGLAELRWRERRVEDALALACAILNQTSPTHETRTRAARLRKLAATRLPTAQLAMLESSHQDRSLPAIMEWALAASYNRPSIDPA